MYIDYVFKDEVKSSAESPFAFRPRGFTARTVPRVSAQELRSLLNAAEGPHKPRWPSRPGTVTVMTKAWILAHFMHYGLNVNEKATIPQLREELRAAIKAGKCNAIPQNIANLERSLQDRYNALKKAHDEAELQKREENFSKLSNPSAEADFSVELFLRKYFMDCNGKADTTKSTQPISLPGLRNRASLHQAAEKIAGLNTQSGGKEPDRVLVIGWNRSDVFRMAANIDGEQNKKQVALSAQLWDRKLQVHKDFARKNARHSRNTNSVSNAIGHYLIRSEAFEEGWDGTDNMLLDIHQLQPNALKASFDFGALEGTMLLSPSEDTLSKIIAGMKEEEEEQDFEGYDSIDEKDSLEDDDEDQEKARDGNQAEDENEDQDEDISRGEIRRGANSHDPRPTKKQKLAPEHPLNFTCCGGVGRQAKEKLTVTPTVTTKAI